MIRLGRRLRLLTTLVVLAVLCVSDSAAAWAPERTAAIHPGVMTFIGGSSFLSGASQCTSNFVFTDSRHRVYLGQAAHCSSTGGDSSTNGCTTKSLRLGTPVFSGDLANGGIQNGTRIGTLAYNSWIAMHKAHEMNPNTCAYNDLALIRIDRSRVHAVNPTVPFWGGPAGLATHAPNSGEGVYTYGNSILRGGITTLSPKIGISLGDLSGTGGWSEDVYTLTPGIPGDSGSGFMNASGKALGVLSTVELTPVAGSNGVGSLAKELAYANRATRLRLRVARGTTAFHSSLLAPAQSRAH